MALRSSKSWAKAKPSPEGEELIKILVSEYQMTREAAIRMMAECGPLLALAVKQRQKLG